MLNFVKKHASSLMALCYSLLIISIIIDITSSDLSNKAMWVATIVKTLPLILFFQVIKTKNPKFLIWFCFLLIGYFISSVLGAFSPLATFWDFLACGTTTVLFLIAMMQARWLAINNNANTE